MTQILCISAANVLHKKNDSTSLKACNLIEEIIEENNDKGIRTEIASLLDYKPVPCIFCGKCAEKGQCHYDKDFNRLYSKIRESDSLFIVVPHYSIIPTKLTMVLEKINQLLYTAWIKNPNTQFELAGKTVGIIAHGGGDERSFNHYKEMILKPLNYLFASLQFKVIGTDDQKPFGAVFGITGMKETENSIFPDMVHDWEEVKEKILPLVNKVIQTRLVTN